jgi:dihydroneopterin aldolase
MSMGKGDRIILSGMQFYGYHGVLPSESALGQVFVVDLEMRCSLAEAGISDDLTQTIDYSRVFTQVQRIVGGECYQLIEALAERIAGVVLDDYPVSEVVVRVKKPHISLGGVFDHVAVEISRKRVDQ